jgi:acetoacetate decarboxylase
MEECPLGAYQAGVYQAMHEAGVEPDWVSGVSIGAINSAIIAGNPPKHRANFVVQMYLDDDPPISAAREIWGFPKKYAHPKLEIVKDTLTGTLEYAGQLVAMGTMGYKHEAMAGNGEKTTALLSKTQINLKIIPGVADGHPEICQLVAYNLTDIVVKGSWLGPGRLHLVPHANARSRIFRCARLSALLYDYNKPEQYQADIAPVALARTA